jgi:class 3 adenylate cyclase
MGTLRLKYSKAGVGRSTAVHTLPKEQFARFNSSILKLGDIASEATTIDAVAAIVDLEGFTAFSKQIDPQLVVPSFLRAFLDWLFVSIAREFTKEELGENVAVWGKLPFFAKFLGDGVLFLWDTRGLNPMGVGNIAVSVGNVCRNYATGFHASHSERYSDIPARLRAGIARGQILSVGAGSDYVGACINMAARLQKLASLPLAISRRGFSPEECFNEKTRANYLTKKIAIRGMGTEELVLVRKPDYEAMSDADKKLFR